MKAEPDSKLGFGFFLDIRFDSTVAVLALMYDEPSSAIPGFRVVYRSQFWIYSVSFLSRQTESSKNRVQLSHRARCLPLRPTPGELLFKNVAACDSFIKENER